MLGSFYLFFPNFSNMQFLKKRENGFEHQLIILGNPKAHTISDFIERKDGDVWLVVLPISRIFPSNKWISFVETAVLFTLHVGWKAFFPTRVDRKCTYIQENLPLNIIILKKWPSSAALFGCFLCNWACRVRYRHVFLS